jgi:hypothetical protein
MAPQIQLAMDAADPPALVAFWKEILGYVDPPPPPGHDTWEDWMEANEVPADRRDAVRVAVDPEGKRPRLYIQKVPEPKTAKNRVHLDVHVTDDGVTLEEVVAKAEGLGAKRLWEKEEFGVRWVTMADPEGNEFCLS